MIVFMATVPPALFGRAPDAEKKDLGDRWSNFVFNYQTLVTGIAAVAAATLTIRQMDKVDAKQEDRHRELVRLQLRQDTIRMQRALRPQLNELQEWLIGLNGRTFYDPIHEQRPGNPLWHALAEFGRSGNGTLILIKETLERKQFRDGVELFDGDTTWTLDQLDGILDNTIRSVSFHLEADNDNLSSDEYFAYESDFKEHADDLKTNVLFCITLAEQLVNHLEQHAREYGV